MKVTINKNSKGILEANKEKIESGYENENYAYTLEFEFPDFLDEYNKVIEFELNGNKVYDALLSNIYELKNNVTQYSFVPCQITFTKAIDEEHTQIYKTNIFYLELGESINADLGIDPESEEVNVLNTLLESVNLAIEEVSNLNSEVTQLAEETRLKGEYAQNQGNYAKEQGDRAKEIADNISDEIVERAEEQIFGYVEDKKDELDDTTEDLKVELRQQASTITFSTFEVNATTGMLIINSAEIFGNLGFSVNGNSGELEVEING